ncbi:hypothetical protein CEN40_05545 [Fischerella thermalis CCMEE 5205]|nr:hypothetical protein CEN40_05545 [Fischerella thermalis CCMEE 5205]
MGFLDIVGFCILMLVNCFGIFFLLNVYLLFYIFKVYVLPGQFETVLLRVIAAEITDRREEFLYSLTILQSHLNLK